MFSDLPGKKPIDFTLQDHNGRSSLDIAIEVEATATADLLKAQMTQSTLFREVDFETINGKNTLEYDSEALQANPKEPIAAEESNSSIVTGRACRRAQVPGG